MNLPRLLGLVMLSLAMVVGGASSQGDKKEDKKQEKKDKKDDKKGKKDNLPQFFKDLDLTADQKAKIADVQKGFAPKIGELQKEIGALNKKVQELKKDEFKDIFGVLTDDQKKKFEDAVAAAKKKKDAGKDKKKDDGKDKKKDEKKNPDKS